MQGRTPFSIATTMKTAEEKEQDEASRLFLSACIEQELARTGLTKEAWANNAKIPGGSGVLTGHMNGARRIQIKAAVQYAIYLRQPIEKFLGAQADDVRNAASLMQSQSYPNAVAMPSPPVYIDPRTSDICQKLAQLSPEGLAEIDRQIERESQLDLLRSPPAKKVGADR